ncbi:MAG TPA: hypothetical protein DEO62_03640, partial [Lachnospiraceae bacterium]|nr:hypothetical protein [Lachnospiraceae bacterium]
MKNKRKKLGRKLLSFLLTLAMVISAFTGMIPGTVVTVRANDVWQEVSVNDMQTGDTIIITNTTSEGNTYGMANDGGTSVAPQAVGLTITDGSLTGSETDLAKCVWTVERDGDGLIFNLGQTWLFCTNSNNGVRVGSNANNQFKIKDDYLYNTATSRYLGVYQNGNDWRCYTSFNNNIKNQTLRFWKRGVSGAETVSVTGVILDESSTALNVGGSKMLTVSISPENATDKKVKWSVGGTDAGAVKLYTDADCTTEVGSDATETLIVYAKGVSAGSA